MGIRSFRKREFYRCSNDELLQELDLYLYSMMISYMKAGKYDFSHGALGYGFYFLKRYENTAQKELKEKYKNYLLDLVLLLDEISDKEENIVRWSCTPHMSIEKRRYNLTLYNGIASIVNFLSRLYVYDDFKSNVTILLNGSVNYIISCMDGEENVISLFPNSIEEGQVDYKSKNHLEWCYGDLGIGISLWRASKALKQDALAKTAMYILKYLAKTMISDASINHRAFGNAQIFNSMYKDTGKEIFYKAYLFWMEEEINRFINQDEYIGDNALSISEGIAGIGLMMIDYLSDAESNWDECLMIG